MSNRGACQKATISFFKNDAQSIKKTVKEIDEPLLKEKLKTVLPALSVAYLTKIYLKKSHNGFTKA